MAMREVSLEFTLSQSPFFNTAFAETCLEAFPVPSVSIADNSLIQSGSIATVQRLW